MLSLISSNHTDYFFLSLFLMMIFLLLSSVGFKKRELVYILGMIGLIIFNVIFNIENPYSFKYFNSYSSFILCSSLPLFIFVATFFVKQFNLISRELTYKQYNSLVKDLQYFNNTYSRRLTMKERLSSIWQFLLKERKKSLF